MSSSPEFVAHALDLLSLLGEVRARAMFGGHGVYAEDAMFALLDDDELFLKTDDVTRPRFVEAGCRQWVYASRAGRMESTGYFRPPDAAHEDPEAMLPWARLALDAALRARAAKAAPRARKGKPPRAGKPGRSGHKSSAPRRRTR